MGNGFLDVFRARDVSQTGLGILVPHGFEGCDLLGEVELIVTLPGTPSFFAKGNLRHRTRHGALSFFGVELTRIGDRERLALHPLMTVTGVGGTGFSLRGAGCAIAGSRLVGSPTMAASMGPSRSTAVPIVVCLVSSS